MSAVQSLVIDTVLDALDRGPRRCRDCLLVINLCECNGCADCEPGVPCEACAENTDHYQPQWAFEDHT